jgi:hypothetical protein
MSSQKIKMAANYVKNKKKYSLPSWIKPQFCNFGLATLIYFYIASEKQQEAQKI